MSVSWMRPLGSTGLQVSALCLGGGPLGSQPQLFGQETPAERGIATVLAAFDSPIRFVDTSNGYSDGESERRIGEVMTRDVMTVLPEMPAFRAAEMMMERKIGSLPVVDEHETLIGIITESDFLAIAHQALHGHTGSELLRI